MPSPTSSHTKISCASRPQPTVSSFQLPPPLDAFNKLHTAGRLTIGSLNNDVYASAGDPAIWLHHGMVGRAWAIWQGQDMEARRYQAGATRTPFNGKFFCGGHHTLASYCFASASSANVPSLQIHLVLESWSMNFSISRDWLTV